MNFIAKYIHKELTTINVVCTKPQGAFYMLINFENYRDKLLKLKIKNAPQLTNFLLNNYSVALLPGVDFHFPIESLTCRLATVDFDGAKAYKAYREGDNLNIDFIINYAPHIFKGLNQIKNFLNKLS